MKIYGRTQKAVEETIRICKDMGVLKEYLTGREKEVITMTMTLFSQDRAVEMYARERELRGIVETYQELGTPFMK